jgi:drug/metabolite transporter (DMT)-like permease
MIDRPLSPRRADRLPRWAIATMPGVFVVLWSTGFIGAKFGLPDAGPATFLALRCVIVATILGAVALATRAPWPRSRADLFHVILAGLLLQGIYLGGVFTAISQGVEAGVSALIVGIQPLLTAALAGVFLGERVTARQWLGLALGLVGVALVVANKIGDGAGTPLGYGLAVLALFGITLGTLYQKRFCAAIDLRSGNAIQFAVCAPIFLGFAAAFETLHIAWTARFMFALAWLCLVLSIGAISLLYLLIRRGAAARVASLFYLVPPCTAVMAFALFGETLDVTAFIGMALVVIAVALVNTGR